MYKIYKRLAPREYVFTGLVHNEPDKALNEVFKLNVNHPEILHFIIKE